MLTAHEQLHRFLDKRSTVFFQAMMNLVKAQYGRFNGGKQQALKDMAYVIGRTMILSDLNGRKRLLMESDRIAAKASKFDAIGSETPISGLPFEEAIEDLISREPRLAKSAAEVSSLYNEAHTFALARSVDLNLTKRLQAAIANIIGSGEGIPQFEQLSDLLTPFTRAYADTVFRTNCNTAYNQGRFSQAKDPDVMEVIPAVRFTSLCLPTSRPNHVAGDGFIAPVTHPVFQKWAPPWGYNCYCGVDFVSKFELERRGLLKDGKVIPFFPATWSKAHPDPGFRTGAISFEGEAA